MGRVALRVEKVVGPIVVVRCLAGTVRPDMSFGGRRLTGMAVGEIPEGQTAEVTFSGDAPVRAGDVLEGESWFWTALEYRISRELEDGWCDGLIPQQYAPDAVRGLAFCGPDGQQHWRFELRMSEGSDWVVPPDDVTGWLVADPVTLTLRIDLRAQKETGAQGQAGATQPGWDPRV